MADTIPGIAEFEAVARGRSPAAGLAARVREGLLSGRPELVERAVTALSLAAAYHRRAQFEREAFAEVPAYRIAPHFSFPHTLTREELKSVDGVLSQRGGADQFGHAVAQLGLSPEPRRAAGHEGAWYPGSNYTEAPMRADGVASFADEWELVQRLGQRIQGTVARVAEVTGCPRAHGNHAKATVLSASLEADPGARPEWRTLIGDTPMQGGLRLSNSAPDLRTVDHKGNLIGFRFSFMTDRSREPFITPNADGGWFTLTANSAPGAHVRTPERHIAFTDSIGSPHGNVLQTIGSIFTQSDGVLRNARNAFRTAREVVRAIPQGKAVSARTRLNELVFHSRHAYRLGPQAVRYVVRVVDPVFAAVRGDGSDDPDYRHRAVVQMVSQCDIVATIGIQVLPDFTGPDAAARTLFLIEDMRADWVGIPVEPFAIVRIPRQTVAPTAERERMVRWFAENPVDLVNAGWMFAPLGAAGRSRTAVYEASRVARSGSCPLGLPPRLKAR